MKSESNNYLFQIPSYWKMRQICSILGQNQGLHVVSNFYFRSARQNKAISIFLHSGLRLDSGTTAPDGSIWIYRQTEFTCQCKHKLLKIMKFSFSHFFKFGLSHNIRIVFSLSLPSELLSQSDCFTFVQGFYYESNTVRFTSLQCTLLQTYLMFFQGNNYSFVLKYIM